MRVTETVAIACSPDTLLAFVMDIEAYAEVDTKIQPVLWSRRTGDLVEFACRPRLIGLRQPAVVQRMQLTPGSRIDISLSPPPANRLARLVADFRASFAVRAVGPGTELVRTLEFTFTPVFRPLGEALFARRLPAEVRSELALAKRHLEG